MSVSTCPRCALRFARRAEVADHLVTDHRFARSPLDGLENLVPVGAGSNRRAPNPLGGGTVC